MLPLFLSIYLRTIQNSLMTVLAGSRVSDRCPLGFLFQVCIYQVINYLRNNAKSVHVTLREVLNVVIVRNHTF